MSNTVIPLGGFGYARQRGDLVSDQSALGLGKVTYTNPELPFGPDAAVKDNFFGLYAMASRRW